jgi:cold shock protein
MSGIKYVGEVLWFDPRKGYGFILWHKDGVQQKDLFAHFSDIFCEGFKTLYKGQKVSFGLGVNMRGDPKAIEIEVLKN